MTRVLSKRTPRRRESQGIERDSNKLYIGMSFSGRRARGIEISGALRFRIRKSKA